MDITPIHDALGYQRPEEATLESKRAHALVARALDVRWLDDGAELRFDPALRDEVTAFAEAFGRRHATHRYEVRSGDVGELWLVARGPGAERWLRRSVASAAPTLGARLRSRLRLADRVRSLTRRARVLPDAFLVGAPRCGTTTLFHALREHPSVVMPARKELAFFNVLHRHGLDWYRSQFPTTLERQAVLRRTGAFATLDATPSYLFHPHAARRIRAVAPGARLLVLLRDPVARAYSQYHWARGMGYELLPFEEACEREAQRTDGELQRMRDDPDYLSFPRSYLSYLAMGQYAEQLEAWLDVFPSEQLLVLCTEDLPARQEESLASVCDHLGLPRAPLPLPERNTGSYPSMPAATRDRLREHFRPHDERLAALLGREPGWLRGR